MKTKKQWDSSCYRLQATNTRRPWSARVHRKMQRRLAACKSGRLYDIYLRNVILLWLRSQWVYKKCIEVEDQLLSADVIQIASEVYSSDWQLSIMQSLSANATAATAVQNQSVRELCMVQAKHNVKGKSMEDKSQGTCKFCYCCGATSSHPKKECPTRNAKCYKCGKKGHIKGSCRSKKEEKEVGRTKDMKKAEASESPWAEDTGNSRDLATTTI